jgi:hypothetical protein
MALQTSGAISLNDIHVEAGGSSSTQASINDSDIRGLIDKSSGAQMAFNEWYGASNVVAPPSGVHKITFTATWSAGNYMVLAYGPQFNHSLSLTIHGGTNASSAPYTRYLNTLQIFGTNTGSSVTNVTRVVIRTNGSNINNPQYTLFDEMNSASSKIKLTDSSNNQIWEANFSGAEVSPLPSFPTNPANSDPYGFNRRPTGKFYYDAGECGESNEYRWNNYISSHAYTGNRHMFDLVLGQQYKFFFES